MLPFTVTLPAVPIPSTLSSSATSVFEPDVVYPQFSDRYSPVTLPDDGCAAASPAAAVISAFAPDVPGIAGAVPSTATFPLTQPSQLVPRFDVDGFTVEQDVLVEESPITTAA